MNDHNAIASLENFLYESHESGHDVDSQGRIFFAQRIPTPTQENEISLLNILNHNQIRSCIRAKIEKNLLEGFAIPELVEGLAEFLMEVVAEDPNQKALFGGS